MSITFSITSEDADAMLADLRRVFPALVAGSALPIDLRVAGNGLPPMQEQPNRDPAPAKTGEVLDPPPKTKKDKTTKKGETIDAVPLSNSSSENAADNSAGATGGETDIPSLDDLRAKLMALGKVEGGHEKAFALLEKVGAKSASTVPEAKRAEVIAEVNKLLEAK